MTYQIGQPVHLEWKFTDSNGDPQDQGTVTVHITLPDGTTTTPTATHVGLGDYTEDYTPTQAGLHSWYMQGSTSTSPVDVFVTTGLTSAALVSVAEAKKYLNKTSGDDEVLGFIQAATEIINRRCGYSAPTQVTETIDGHADASGRGVLMLTRTPVLSVSAITTQLQGLPQVDITSLIINNDTGAVYLGNWFAWYGPVTVTYTAGRPTVPPALKTACLLLVKWLWQTKRGGSTATPNMGGDETVMVDGMELPARAVALMNMTPYMAAPAIA